MTLNDLFMTLVTFFCFSMTIEPFRPILTSFLILYYTVISTVVYFEPENVISEVISEPKDDLKSWKGLKGEVLHSN